MQIAGTVVDKKVPVSLLFHLYGDKAFLEWLENTNMLFRFDKHFAVYLAIAQWLALVLEATLYSFNFSSYLASLHGCG